MDGQSTLQESLPANLDLVPSGEVLPENTPEECVEGRVAAGDAVPISNPFVFESDEEEEIPPTQPDDECDECEVVEDLVAQKNLAPEEQKEQKEHHILDEIEKKYLSRGEQDAPFGLAGKGRRKRKEEGGSGDVEVKPKSKRGRGQKVGDDVEQVSAESQPKKPRQPRGKKAQKGDVDQGESAASQPKKSRQPRGKKSENATGSTGKSKASPKASAKAKALAKAKASSSKARQNRKQDEEPKRRTRRTRTPQPAFKTCSVVPYWSRNAVALKVNTGKGKSGMTQAGLKVFRVCMHIQTY